jgi:SulP family sulfate permease
MTDLAAGPSTLELFTPKLVTVLREHYGLNALRSDALAGLTVAIVALPLSMAIAIASGATPAMGLYTSIAGGFLVSALGGSRFQIGGPAGAFIVLVAATVHRFGIDGLILATLLAGMMLTAGGLLRLGTFVRYIPHPVTVGFTSGIAVIIGASQLKDLLGLTLTAPEPGPLLEKLGALGRALPTVSLPAAGLAVASVVVILALRRTRPHWPGMLIAVAAASAATALLHLPIETIGSRFGGIPGGLPLPHLPQLDWARVLAVLPAAASFALLGSIESLLSAVVGDSMTGRRHRSNCELVAQGVANMGSALIGGFCVTGTIARTATNIRAGARGPVAGMLHAAFLLAFLLLAAPLAAYVPLAALAGVLAVVAWNMAERHEFASLIRASRGDAAVLLATFLITLFKGLAEGIVIGFALAALLFLHRMARSVEVERVLVAQGDLADGDGETTGYDPRLARDPEVVVCRVSGAFFFGAAAAVGMALDGIGEQPNKVIIDLSDAPVLDSTGAATILAFARKARRRGAQVLISGASDGVKRTLLAHGLRALKIRFRKNVQSALG